MTKKRNVLKRSLLCALFTICGVSSAMIFNNHSNSAYEVKYDSHVAYKINDTICINALKTQIRDKKMDSIKAELKKEVKNYIEMVAPKAESVLLSDIFVEKALEHDLDLCFMTAQTQIETTFGTLGAGRPSSRRSLFGVKAPAYPSYERAVDHYIEVLHKWYLTNGRTEQDLMKHYVNNCGNRYAGSLSYEKHLSATYASIKKSTQIFNLQNAYKNI